MADRAAADIALFTRVAEHREIFFRLNWVDYTTLRIGSLRLAPPDHHRDDWQRDYEQMAESMFYGERPDFEEVLRVVSSSNDSIPGPPCGRRKHAGIPKADLARAYGISRETLCQYLRQT